MMAEDGASPAPGFEQLEGHGCAAPGCSRFGCYGFAPPLVREGHLWACPEHREQILRSLVPDLGKADPRQRSLL